MVLSANDKMKIQTPDRAISYLYGVGPRITCKEELIRHSKIKPEYND